MYRSTKNTPLIIPFVVHEAALARKERIIKNLIRAVVVTDTLFAATCLFLIQKKR